MERYILANLEREFGKEKQIILLNKWNRQKHKYEDYGVPDNWNVKCCCNDLEEIVNCAQCGMELKYGDCYTSLEVHTDMGMGFGVCEDCYEAEWQRRKKEDKKE